MATAFPIEGGLLLVLARGVADAGLLSAFGALLALDWLAPPVLADLAGDAPIVARRLAWLAWSSLAAAFVLTGIWLVLQSAALAGSALDAPMVLRETVFGHLVLARLGLLCLTALALVRRLPWTATVLAGAAVATQAGHGHAWAMQDGPSWLLLSSVLHLLAAGAWLGGLLPLLVLVAGACRDNAALASARFSALGSVCVVLLAGTAIFQATVLIGTVPGLIGTTYGLVALTKLAGLLALLGFAARNRFRLTPALGGDVRGAAKARLVRSIAIETAVGLLVVLAAGLLTSLPPSMHEQPTWPFAWRLSLEAVGEDAALRHEAVLAAAVIVVAIVTAAMALLRGWRAHWPIAALGAAAACLAVPHLDLLLAEAYPTQYWQSPTGFASASIADGAALFPAHCAGCHGNQGHGDGPSARDLAAPPADLTAGHLWAHEDGELFWFLSQGISAPDGTLAMPGFAGVLTEAQRWALIDWVRANNAGLTWAATGAWPRPVQAPGLIATCAGGRTRMLDDWRGQVVRIVFGPARPMPGIVTIQAAANPAGSVGEVLCAVDDDAVWQAYAAVTGTPMRALAGAQVLVDRAGWLRAVQLSGATPSWNVSEVLTAAVRDIDAPLAEPAHGHAGMRM